MLISSLPRLLVSQRLELPRSSGCYFYLDERSKVIYIGKARNLCQRVGSYFLDKDLGAKTQNLVNQIKEIRYIVTENETDAFLLEAYLIRHFLPKYNIDLKDGKNYPLVLITKETNPKVIVARKIGQKGQYFGPYAPTVHISYLLKMLRKIYPFYTKDHKSGEVCLSGQIGFCPCANNSNYKSNLKQIKLVLSGKRPQAIKNLNTKMLILAQKQNFEEAKIVKDKLDLLKNLGGAKFTPWEYVTNPNMTEDLQDEKVRALEALLKIKISRIEAIDISHTGFKQITAALVVFVNGIKNNKEYRHFKINLKNASDVEAISEVVKRRFKHLDWPKPDVLLIDGGISQVHAACHSGEGRNLFVIGLAKREETIFLPTGQEIKLEKSDFGLQLLQQLRDEAHRFSRRLHFLLRKRNMLN